MTYKIGTVSIKWGFSNSVAVCAVLFYGRKKIYHIVDYPLLDEVLTISGIGYSEIAIDYIKAHEKYYKFSYHDFNYERKRLKGSMFSISTLKPFNPGANDPIEEFRKLCWKLGIIERKWLQTT